MNQLIRCYLDLVVKRLHCVKQLTLIFGNISHLKEHKFRHNFQDAINSLYSCGIVFRFFLQWTHFSNQRLSLINKIKDIDKRIFCKKPTLSLLFGDEKFSITDNKFILEATIQFLISSGRFDFWLSSQRLKT